MPQCGPDCEPDRAPAGFARPVPWLAGFATPRCRHRRWAPYLADDRGLIGPEGAEARICLAAVAGVTLQGDGRQKAAFGDADGGRGDIDIETRGDDRRMFLGGQRYGVLAAAGQDMVDGFGGLQLCGRVADHLGVGRLADGEIDSAAFRSEAPAQPRFGLRGVGRGYVAGIETPLGDRRGFRAGTRHWSVALRPVIGRPARCCRR